MAPRKTATKRARTTKVQTRSQTRTRGPARKTSVKKKPPPHPVVAPPPPPPLPDDEGLLLARLAANAALDKKAEDVVIMDVRGLTSYADFFVVATGASDRQVSAIADNIDDVLRKAGHRRNGIEGYTRGHWVLIDFGDVVCHVFYEEARGFYDLEGLWADARRIPVA